MKPRFALRLAHAIWRMYIRKPVFLSYNITNRCNQRCRMCNVWRAEAEELTLSEIGKILADAKKCGIRIIELTGGETFLRKDFFEICRILDEYGLLYTTTTNGTLLNDERVELLRGAEGLLQVAVSVDSLDRDLYARLRGQDHLPVVLKNLERLAKAGLNVPVKVNFTLSRHNYQETFRMLDYVQSMGLFMSVFPVNQGPQSQHRSYDPLFISSGKERQEMSAIFLQLARLRKEGAPLWEYSRFYTLAADFVKGMPVGHCDASVLYLDLHADGKLAPCLDRETFADLRKESFRDALMKAGGQKNAIAACSQSTPCCYTCTYNVSITARHIFGFSFESMYGRLVYLLKKASDRKTGQGDLR